MTALTVKGNFIVDGTFEEPVNIFPSQLMSVFRVEITKSGNGYVSISHANITNPYLNINYLGYSSIKQERIEFSHYYRY